MMEHGNATVVKNIEKNAEIFKMISDSATPNSDVDLIDHEPAALRENEKIDLAGKKKENTIERKQDR